MDPKRGIPRIYAAPPAAPAGMRRLRLILSRLEKNPVQQCAAVLTGLRRTRIAVRGLVAAHSFGHGDETAIEDDL